MKFRKILCRVSGGILGALAVVAAGGYCWLYSWSWGSAPAPHAGFSPAEVNLLLGFDNYIVNQAPLLLNEYIEQEVLMSLAAGIALPDAPESAEPQLSWKEEIYLSLVTSRISRQLLAPLREDFHQVCETGSARGADPHLAVLALQKKDVPLFRLLVEKGAPLKAVNKEGRTIYLLEQAMCASDLQSDLLPVSERLELMDWLVARGADIHEIAAEDVLLLSEASLMRSNDDTGALLDWFLRRGYRLDPARVAAILLRYAGTQPIYQKLVAENILPAPPQELMVADSCCTSLQLVAGAHAPAPDMLRWLLSLGHQPNAMPGEEPGCASSQSARSPLDACLASMQYMSIGQGEAEDARLRGKLEMLDILLQHGARPTAQTRGLLPFNAALEREMVALFRKHGHHITAGADPYNACCVPD